jgi:hypothetical protein
LADRDFKKKKCETAVPAEEKLPRVFDEQLRGTAFRKQLFKKQLRAAGLRTM